MGAVKLIKELTGSAGTGNQILQNWRIFSYKFDQSEYHKNCKDECPNIYSFNFKFGSQKGDISIAIKEGLITKSTTIDSGFDRPLGAYNDTTDYNSGLYEVARRIMKETFPEIIIN